MATRICRRSRSFEMYLRSRALTSPHDRHVDSGTLPPSENANALRALHINNCAPHGARDRFASPPSLPFPKHSRWRAPLPLPTRSPLPPTERSALRNKCPKNAESDDNCPRVRMAALLVRQDGIQQRGRTEDPHALQHRRFGAGLPKGLTALATK